MSGVHIPCVKEQGPLKVLLKLLLAQIGWGQDVNTFSWDHILYVDTKQQDKQLPPLLFPLCISGRAENISGLEYEGSSESSSSTEPDQLSSGPALFCLEYEADSGKITSIVVHQVCDWVTCWGKPGFPFALPSCLLPGLFLQIHSFVLCSSS